MLDGGIPGPCEETVWPGTPSERRTVFRYDAAGRVLSKLFTDENGTVFAKATYQYDACGRLVFSEEATPDAQQYTRIEHDYRVDGLLGRTVTETAFDCQQQTFAYPPGDAGEALLAVDGVSCAPVHEYQFGPDGRVDQVTNDATHPGSVDLFTYLPDGGVSSFTENANGYWTFGNTWDETGAVTSNFMVFPNGGGSDRENMKYDERHLLIEAVSTSIGRGPCGFSKDDTTYSYDDAGVLRSADDFAVDTCPNSQVHLATLYDHPAPGVQVAQSFDAHGGPAGAVRTTVDARGNVLSIESQDSPDAGWQTTVVRSYECFAH